MSEPGTVDHLNLSADEVLTTTRAVRKRLDLERPVPLEVVKDALEVALQAPSSSHSENWHWIVLTDPAKKKAVADWYRKAYNGYRDRGAAAGPSQQEQRDPETMGRVRLSSEYLADVMDQVPVLVIAAMDVPGGFTGENQAGAWGSLIPAAWSLALALRERGLGTAWTTLHLQHEREVARELGIPDTVRQAVLLPVAYTKGTEFKPAPRRPVEEVLHINGW